MRSETTCISTARIGAKHFGLTTMVAGGKVVFRPSAGVPEFSWPNPFSALT